ncbi:MAG: hypothetical protein L0215_03105 [Gemmataceae bacterium]|nr:hypothetical protein [Gemmataceae bacterium]
MLFLLDVFVWYPNSPRGVFDRIQIGMTKSDVDELLATIDEGSLRTLQLVLDWTEERQTVHSGPNLTEFLYRASQIEGNSWIGTKPRFEKVTTEGIILVNLDAEGRVTRKVWFAYEEQRPGLIQRIRSWFGF